MKFYYRYKLILKNIAPLASSIKEKLLLKLVNEYKWMLSRIYLLVKVEVLLHRSIFPLKNDARLITDRFAFCCTKVCVATISYLQLFFEIVSIG